MRRFVSFKLRPPYHWQSTILIYWIGSWVHLRAGLDDRHLKFLPLPGLELGPLGRTVCGSVAIPTALSQTHNYKGSTN
jgi:hypothetical protein